MKKYIFEQCRNSTCGSVIRVYDSEHDAIAHGDFEWGITPKETRNEIQDLPCGVFRIYEVDLPEEQLVKMTNGEPTLSLTDFETRQVKNYLTSEFLMKC